MIEEGIAEESRRTLVLDKDLVRSLATVRGQDLIDLVGQLPRSLTVKEVGDIGLQSSNTSELKYPSRDGFGFGWFVERRAIYNLGVASIDLEDPLTAESAMTHLWQHGGLASRIRAFRLAMKLSSYDRNLSAEV